MNDAEAETLVLALVAMFAAAPHLDDDQAIDHLVERGFSRIYAELAVALVPTAFGRLALRKRGFRGFSANFLAKNKAGKWIQFFLNDQTLWRTALRIGVEGQLSEHECHASALRSAEVNAVANLKSPNGDDVAWSPLAILAPAAEDLPRARAVRWWQRWLGRV